MKIKMHQLSILILYLINEAFSLSVSNGNMMVPISSIPSNIVPNNGNGGAQSSIAEPIISLKSKMPQSLIEITPIKPMLKH